MTQRYPSALHIPLCNFPDEIFRIDNIGVVKCANLGISWKMEPLLQFSSPTSKVAPCTLTSKYTDMIAKTTLGGVGRRGHEGRKGKLRHRPRSFYHFSWRPERRASPSLSVLSISCRSPVKNTSISAVPVPVPGNKLSKIQQPLKDGG